MGGRMKDEKSRSTEMKRKSIKERIKVNLKYLLTCSV